MNKLIIITGQTATGKTKLALEYAQKYKGDLINCDSRQIYKHLDIITGKDRSLFEKVKVWLYDVIYPDEHFSSFNFVKLAVPVIKKVLVENKTPIIVGGTYLYLKHLQYGIETENIPPDWDLRKELGNKSVSELLKIYENLRKKSFNLPTFMAGQLSTSEKNNLQRLIRKIEIIMYSTKYHIDTDRSTMVFSLAEKLGSTNIRFEFLGLKFKDSESLRKAIEKRVEERLKQGAIDEVKNLLKMGYKESDPGLKTIGYQQLIAYLKGKLSKEEATHQWINKEVQYAKRQYTFMKKDKNIHWKEI